MAERPDLRQIAVSIAEALEGFEQADLSKMLTYVFKEYVVEGAPPVLVSQVDGIDAFEGLSFAQLIEQLQARLDLPELEHFQVRGEQVMVRVGGVMSPLGGEGRANPALRASSPTLAAAPAAAPPAAPAGGERPAPRPVADEAIRRGRGDLTGGQRGVASPPPSRGLSINSRPASAGSATAASPSPGPAPAADGAPTPTATATPSDPEATDDKPTPGDDDASVRFSLLELD